MSGYSASSSYFLPLISHLKNASNTSEAQVMKKYMKNNFEFYGVRAPQCKDFLKQHIENQGLPQDMSQLSHIVHYAWECPHRELQYIGMYIMDKCQNIWQSGDQLKSLFEFMIKHKSWWDTVDFISSSLVNYWWKMDPELLDKSITPEWNKSDNFWLNRTSIIYQLKSFDKWEDLEPAYHTSLTFQWIFCTKSNWLGAAGICQNQFQMGAGFCSHPPIEAIK